MFIDTRDLVRLQITEWHRDGDRERLVRATPVEGPRERAQAADILPTAISASAPISRPVAVAAPVDDCGGCPAEAAA